MRAIALVLFVAACTSPTTEADAGLDATASDDAGRPPRTWDGGTSYVPCTSDSDCAGGTCDHDFPRGQCTVACSVDADCPEHGVCRMGRCFASCLETSGDWCRDDQLCLAGACLASCTARTDLPELSCPTGGACASNFCTASRYGSGAVGGACSAARDCASGRCELPSNGWPGGACTMLVRLPPTSVFDGTGLLPAGRCPDPLAMGLPPIQYPIEGGPAVCLPRCAIDGDCRDGYYCDHHGIAGAAVHSDGVCLPWLCADGFPDCPAPRVCLALVAGGTTTFCSAAP